MNEKKIVLGVLGVTIGLIALGLVLVMRSAQTGNVSVEASAGATLELANTNKDWGEIKMDDGLAIAEFEIKNAGNETLKLFNGTTSCACTNAKVEGNGKTSGYFGMHSKGKNVFEVEPGETVKLIAEFDPAYHGPQGVGPVSRIVTMSTNDPDNPELRVTMVGTVIK